MIVQTWTRRQLENGPLPPDRTAVVSFTDPDATDVQLPGAIPVLRVRCHDIDRPYDGLMEPTLEHACEVLDFYAECRSADTLVVQCDAGVGRSLAVAIALDEFRGRKVRKAGLPYNRLLYRLMMEAAGKPVPPEPQASIVVRLKYGKDALVAFTLSMMAQRWRNWRLAPHDGKRRWGNAERQGAIDRATGDFIGLQNDDNYLTPGYIDTMVDTMLEDDADLALCHYLSKYKGYEEVATKPEVGSADVGCFIGRSELVKSVRWEGDDFEADGRYVVRLVEAARKCVIVPVPLYVKN